MNKDRVIELATYIIVPLLIWVVTPLLGKFFDSFYFLYQNTFADSISIILVGTFLILCGTALAFWTIFLFKTIGQGDEKVFVAICEEFGKNITEHIAVYGAGNDQRLTGKHETQSITQFSYGAFDRGASIRIGNS